MNFYGIIINIILLINSLLDTKSCQQSSGCDLILNSSGPLQNRIFCTNPTLLPSEQSDVKPNYINKNNKIWFFVGSILGLSTGSHVFVCPWRDFQNPIFLFLDDKSSSLDGLILSNHYSIILLNPFLLFPSSILHFVYQTSDAVLIINVPIQTLVRNMLILLHNLDQQYTHSKLRCTHCTKVVHRILQTNNELGVRCETCNALFCSITCQIDGIIDHVNLCPHYKTLSCIVTIDRADLRSLKSFQRCRLKDVVNKYSYSPPNKGISGYIYQPLMNNTTFD